MSLRILTYKRTHTGDPDMSGRFGVNDCMRTVRNRRFDAVIGVGGLGMEPRSFGIAGKLTWIGVGPQRSAGLWTSGADIVSFERFILLDDRGPDLRTIAPNLARRIFDGRVRVLIDSYSEVEYQEAAAILELAPKFSVPNANVLIPSKLGSVCSKRRVQLATCRNVPACFT